MDPPAPFAPGATRRVRPTVRVGVGVIVIASGSGDESSSSSSSNKNNNDSNSVMIYAGVRKGSHGTGSIALPGGHLEMYESWEDCAVREVKEETNLDLVDVRHVHSTNDIMKQEDKHYVTIFMIGRPSNESAAKPENMEPHKCEGWRAYSWEELKTLAATKGKLFGPLQKLVEDDPPSIRAYLEQNP